MKDHADNTGCGDNKIIHFMMKTYGQIRALFWKYLPPNFDRALLKAHRNV